MEEQFLALLDQHKESFYRIAYSYVRNEQDALDVIQESVCKGYVGLKKVKEKQYLKTWFTKIVINTSIDTLNRSKKIISLETPDQKELSYETCGIERKLDLYEALSFLKDQERAIILLRYFEDQKLEDIARVMSLSSNTVKTKLYRGLKKLKSYLGEEMNHGE